MVRTVNFLLYQIGWFALVLGGAYHRPWVGVTSALGLVAIHMFLTTQRGSQSILLLVAAGMGLFVDTTLLGMGVFSFPSGMLVSWLPPVWMTVLWIQFATTFRYCLRWLSGRYGLCVCLGLMGAPLVFLGGERLGAVSFLDPRSPHLLMLAALWCIAIPTLVYASDRIHASVEQEAGYRGFGSQTPHAASRV